MLKLCLFSSIYISVLTVSHNYVAVSIPYLYVTSQYGLSTPTVNITLYRFPILLITADMSYQSTSDTEWTTAVTIVTNIRFFPSGKNSQRNMYAPFSYWSTIISNIGMYGCSKQIFPFDGPHSSPPLCCAQLAGLSVVTTSPFNAPDRGLFAPIYVFSPITPWQAGGCQATLLRW